LVRLLIFAVLFSSLLSSGYANTNNVTAKSWLVSDASGKIIKGENTQEVRSIASISKLITVMVVLDAKQNLDEEIYFKTVAKSKHKKTESTGLKFTRRQLIDMAIVHSDNRATMTLCNNYPGGSADCINAMNFKVAKLGMMHTSMSDPTGLDARNVSTAEDLIKLVHAARGYPEIVNASKQSRVEIKIKKKWLVFNNTNPMIGKDQRIVVSKAGWITASGGCIVMGLDTELGERTVVVLGSKSTRTRIPEAEFIADIKE
jgi:D-alanyl-D-alanine endopeptidase (penicillin-binding protein 7)